VNVARDFVASGLALDVVNEVKEPFEIKLRRIELSILVDNLISNAGKAHSQHMIVTLKLLNANTLQMDFQDDGRGLSAEVPTPETVFELGFTTTSGSGLGLYHAKSIVDSLGGTIRVVKNRDRGITFRIEVMR
jgi:signal transduction histidine kinase